MYIVIIMLALHLKKVASIIKWMALVWNTCKNISWSCCHHKSCPWSLFICVNVSGMYDESDHKLTATRAFTLGDQALHLDTTQYCGGVQVATFLNIMMMRILTCGFLYYRSYPCHGQILPLSNTCDKLILITLHVVMTKFTKFLVV